MFGERIDARVSETAWTGPDTQSLGHSLVKRNQSGFEVLPKRWVVERTFAWLGINRRLSKDFERFAQTSLAFIQTAIIKLMTKRLARFGHS